MSEFTPIYRCTDLPELRKGLVDAIKAGENDRANAYAWQAGQVARAQREGTLLSSTPCVDLDFDAEHRRARQTIAEEKP